MSLTAAVGSLMALFAAKHQPRLASSCSDLLR
jgi:hypothetical protein